MGSVDHGVHEGSSETGDSLIEQPKQA